MTEPDEDLMRAAILRAFPEFATATFEVLAMGWDSTAIDVDDSLIFKFPRDREAERRLVTEAALLTEIRPQVSMSVPDLTIHSGPPLFSSHRKLKGSYLLTVDYGRLADEERQQLANDLGCFYAELHQLDIARMAEIGADVMESWEPLEAVRAKALPALPRELRAFAQQVIVAFERLPPDPHGRIYGFFDGHGWNMAFDHTRGRLNGIYDFADSGIGPLHQEFIYSNFISPELTERIVSAYESFTDRDLDRRRIVVLTGMHRLSELSQLADDPNHVPAMVRFFSDWAETIGAL